MPMYDMFITYILYLNVVRVVLMAYLISLCTSSGPWTTNNEKLGSGLEQNVTEGG